MAYTSISLILLAITPLLLLLSPQALAQTPSAPSPTTSTGPVNLTGILDKNGQFTTFIRLLISTQIATQITNQLNGSTEGMTVFAPTDNAFNTLKAGTLNGLSDQEQVQLILYHVLPKYYTLSQFLTVSNPVKTQASGQGGGVWGLNFTGQANQVNVSSGLVQVQINNVLNKDFPLAVYQLEKVLLPNELFGVKPPTSAPPPPAKTPTSSENTTETAVAPSSKTEDSGSSGGNVGFGLVIGFVVMCMGALS